MSQFPGSVVEQAALAWLEGLGCGMTLGIEILPDESRADRIIGKGF